MSEQTELTENSPYLNKSYLNNLPPTPLLPTLLGKYTSNQLMTDKLDYNNRSGVEHVLFLVITEGSKELEVGGVHSENTIIQSNQASANIDRLVQGDYNISLIILKSCTETQKNRIGAE